MDEKKVMIRLRDLCKYFPLKKKSLFEREQKFVRANEGISLEMEKYLSQMPGDQKAKATKILEINPNHDIFKVLQNVYEKSPDELNEYTDILYQQAMLIEGFTLDDPVESPDGSGDFSIHF